MIFISCICGYTQYIVGQNHVHQKFQIIHSCSTAGKSQMHACITHAEIQKTCHTTKQIRFHMVNCSKTGHICVVVNLKLKSLKLLPLKKQ